MLVAWQKSALNCGIEFKECLGIDPSNNMLELAIEKCEKLENKASFIQAQAKDLKGVGSNSVDILSIAYGLRNIVEREEALKEFFRVLKPRGVLVILEFLKKITPHGWIKSQGFTRIRFCLWWEGLSVKIMALILIYRSPLRGF